MPTQQRQLGAWSEFLSQEWLRAAWTEFLPRARPAWQEMLPQKRPVQELLPEEGARPDRSEMLLTQLQRKEPQRQLLLESCPLICEDPAS